MTTTDPSTTPIEAEREARVKQASDFLALAMTPEHLSMWAGNSSQLDYENGVQAIRDAIVGQGYATLAANANLDRIATALEALAALPPVVQSVADQVGGELHDLNDRLREGCEFADSTAAATGSISVSMHDLTDAVRDLADVIDRPRWWQWRLRRALRQQTVVPEPDDT
ncbi:hypothetical protein [Nonomuraea rubra]|uniref:hypothetical protein n=1 Tax=Nonomuraea rubra TaxID=46180 RepID=UPI00340972C3